MREVRKSNNEGVLHGVGVELLGVFFWEGCAGGVILKRDRILFRS